MENYGNNKVKYFTCRSQFYCMAFGQLTYRNSLRDILACLTAHQDKLYHMGIRGGVSFNNLSNANMNRDWRIYAEFSQVLINIARILYAGEQFSEDISEPVYALDSTTISLSLTLFPWAEFRKKRAVSSSIPSWSYQVFIPTFIEIKEARPNDINILDELILESGAFYIMDRAYFDFERLYNITRSGAFFITRTKCNIKWKRRYSRQKDSSLGIISDQIVISESERLSNMYPAPLCRVQYMTPVEGKVYGFLTNIFHLSAQLITGL